MASADRLFRLVQILRGRGIVTAARLAEELGVSVRTVYRDIEELRGADVPVRGEAGIGYALDRTFQLPPMTFDPEELQALALGARVVETWGDPELARAARSALTKVESVLPRKLRGLLGDAPLYVPDYRRRARVELGVLRRAILERRKVAFTYVRADGTTSQRRVRPLGLYFWGKSWSLAAWCELREDWRSFRPDRMSALEVLDERFDDEVDLTGFVQATRAQGGTNES